MKRPLILMVVLLALSLQGPMAAYAAVAPGMSSDCPMFAQFQSDSSHKRCCPSGSHTVSCCLDVSPAMAGVPLSLSSLPWFGRSALMPQWRNASFSSRGDSPLIRPPIL